MKKRHRKIVLFYSHSSDRSDNILRDKLARFLRPLVRETHVEEWSDRQILAGTASAQERKHALEAATHILLLLSAEYLASEVCYQEMLDALERQKSGKARVIAILLHPCLLPKTLEESLSCLPSNGQPVSVWQKRNQALSDVARGICQILGLPLASLRRGSSTPRDVLLDKVFAYWIEGLLEPSLKEGETHLNLALQEQPSIVINPWSSQVQELRRVPRPLSAGRSIDQIFDEAHGELLILGEPGAGKTTLLLELARTLLERAEKDERIRMPIVFHLSLWAEKRQPLKTWLVEELWTKYRMSHNIGQDWIDAGKVLPLLDGLDEVRQDARAACVEAINDYYQSQLERGSSPFVVCCRSEEYTALSTHMMLQHAVRILPLTDLQINTYLEPFGEQVNALKQALDEDAELHSLARQPLMLNFFIIAYQGAAVEEIPVGATSEKVRHIIFAKYVIHMLNRRGQLKRWKQQQMIHWLVFLAKQMKRHNQTIFSVESLELTWLPKNWRTVYVRRVALVFGLGGALINGAIWGLVGGLVFGYAGALGGLFFGLISGWGYGRNFGKVSGNGDVKLSQLIFRDPKAKPAPALTWDWWRVRLGLMTGLGGWQIAWLPLLRGQQTVLRDGKLSGKLLSITLASYLSMCMLAGVFVEEIIWRLSGSAFVLVNGLFFGLLIWLTYGMLALLFFGVSVFVRHFILRFFLWRRGDLPWNLVAFLDVAAERLLLRKVGESYIFVHRQLRDHLASQEVPTPSNDTTSDPSQSGLNLLNE